MGCSGKTQLAYELFDHLKDTIACELVSLDDFCKPKAERYNSDRAEGLQVYYNNFEEDQFEEHIIKAAYYNHNLNYSFTALHAPSNTYSVPKSYQLKPSGILVIEGIHLFKHKFQKYFDLKIFVDISLDTQIARAMQRDPALGNSVNEIDYKYTKRYQPSYDYYLSQDKPLNCIDLIIDNNEPQKPSLIRLTPVQE